MQRNGSGTGPGCVVHAQLLKLPKSGVGFPMSLQKKKFAQAHSEGGQWC
jgi:hypothetical protein